MSADFCSQACQARWQAALVGVAPDGGLTAPPTESFATYTPQSRMRVSWVPQLADPAHPTAAELAGGTDLTDLVAGPIRFGSGASYQDDEDELTECTCHLSRMPPCAWCESGGEAATPTVVAGGAVAEAALTLGLGHEVQSLRFEPVGEDRWEITLRTPVPIEPGQNLLLTGFDGSSDGTYTVVEVTPSGRYKIVAAGDHPEVGEAAAQPASNYGGMLADLEEGICIECGRLRYEHQSGTCPSQRSWIRRLWKWVWFHA
jgi:hypothetical protein